MPLLVERDGAVLRLTLNRPEQRNALDAEMFTAIDAALDRAEADAGIRIVSFAAKGRHFSAGADLRKVQALLSAAPEDSARHARLAASVMHRLATFPRPVIAAAHGSAHGAGVGLLLACDVVLAASDARFGLGEVRLGLCPVLVAPLFAAAVGRRVAGRYLLTGDGFAAEEARRIGVVHEVVPPAELRDELDAYAARLVAAGPGSVAATKRLLWGRRALLSEAWDIDWIVEETVRYRASPEAAEGVSAFLEKRAPAWLGAS